MVTRKLQKRSIVKAAIDDYLGWSMKDGIKKTIKVLKLIEEIDTDEEEIVKFLKKSLENLHDHHTYRFNDLEITPGVIVTDAIDSNNDIHIKLKKYFMFIVIINAYYGVTRMGILFKLHEGDSYVSYDMSYLTETFDDLYDSSTSVDEFNNLILTIPMNKEQIKNSKNFGMKQFYKEMAKDPYQLNSDGDFYLGDGMVLDQFGNIKEE